MHFFFTGPRTLGIRPGVVLGAADFRSRRSLESPIEGSFIYIIQARERLVKIGVTTDPRARIASLQTGSPYPLTFAAITATPGTGYDIEADAHLLLQRYQLEGEWFNVSPTVALAAVEAAARGLQQPLLRVSLDRVDKILAIAQNAPQGSRARPGWLFLRIIAGALIGVTVALVVSVILNP